MNRAADHKVHPVAMGPRRQVDTGSKVVMVNLHHNSTANNHNMANNNTVSNLMDRVVMGNKVERTVNLRIKDIIKPHPNKAMASTLNRVTVSKGMLRASNSCNSRNRAMASKDMDMASNNLPMVATVLNLDMEALNKAATRLSRVVTVLLRHLGIEAKVRAVDGGK